jgi:hypothetical protein
MTLGAMVSDDTPTYSSFYNGFIYNVCVWQAKLTSFESVIDFYPTCSWPQNYCNVCPIDTCLSNCEWNKYIGENGVCRACDPSCTTGCVRSTNCHQCVDPECAECSSWENCTACIENASNTDDCTCDEFYNFDAETTTCVRCAAECTACEDDTNMSCSSCSDGYYLHHNT